MSYKAHPEVIQLQKSTITESISLDSHITPIQNTDLVSEEQVNQQVSTSTTQFPANLEKFFKLIVSQNGVAFAIFSIHSNCYALKIGSRRLNATIQDHAGKRLKKLDLADINDYLTAKAEASGLIVNVYSRVAPTEDGAGIEIDVADAANTRIRVTANGIEIIIDGSAIPFFKNPFAKPMVMPAKKGNLKLLKKYVNLNSPNFLLLTAWLSYTLAHPKVSSSKFVILVLLGDPGAGKTFLCEQIIINLLDPSVAGVQIFPKTAKDLAILTQNSHISCFDNTRNLSADMSDALCVAATGGVIGGRALYTDDDQKFQRLHAPLVVNGVHPFITESDASQRCLTFEMRKLTGSTLRSESDMLTELEVDLPIIFRGLLDLISDVFKHVPNAKVTSPERMIDFSKWLAAMELAQDLPVGVYQKLYSSIVNDAQLDSLSSNPLGAAIIDFAHNKNNFIGSKWTGMPSELLFELEAIQSSRHSGLPSNAIALSKRLPPIRSGLATQGINVELSRGKHRTITITILGDDNDYYIKHAILLTGNGLTYLLLTRLKIKLTPDCLTYRMALTLD